MGQAQSIALTEPLRVYLSAMSASVDLQNLTIKSANEQQMSETIKHFNDHWGTPEAGLEYFTWLHRLSETKEYGKDGKLVYWVLVPLDDKDTLDFYSCCRTYRRNAVVLHASSDQPAIGTGYVVSGVVTPKNHRGHGYAQRMLSLLHYALAPHVYPDPDVKIDIPSYIYPAAFSTLYSDVGSYYERCAPLAGQPGWKAVGPISTIWKLSETIAKLNDHPSSSASVQLLSEQGVNDLLKSDSPDLTNFPRSPGKTYIAIAPTASPNLYQVTRSAFHPLHKKSPDTRWGARATEDDWITWTFDYSSPRTLVITRLKTSPTSFPALLLAALGAGELQGCEVAEVWNIPQELEGLAESSGGTTSERNDHLPALKWYGSEPAEDIVWLMNENYTWA